MENKGGGERERKKYPNFLAFWLLVFVPQFFLDFLLHLSSSPSSPCTDLHFSHLYWSLYDF